MLFFLISVAQGSCGDLTRPFIATEDGRICNWSLSGSAYHTEEQVILAPPVQFRRGSIWSDAEFPDKDITMKIAIRIPQTDGGGFSIFFIKEYGAEGTLYGGPNCFHGLAIVCSIEKTPDSSYALGIHALFNPKSAFYTEGKLPQPDFFLFFSRREQLNLCISFNQTYVSLFTQSGKETGFLFSSRIPFSLAHNSIGITAQSDRTVGAICLCNVAFYTPVLMCSTKPRLSRSGFGKYHVDDLHLRHPGLNHTGVIISEGRNRSSERPSTDVFDIIDEIGDVLADVATFHDVNEFVTNSLLPMSDSWQRRSVRIVERLKAARSVCTKALEYTNAIFASLNSSISDSLNEAAFDLRLMSDEILANVKNGIEIEKNCIGLAFWLLAVASLEASLTIVSLCIKW